MIISSDEAAALLGVTRNAIYILVCRDKLHPLDRTVKPYEFAESEVVEMERARRTKAEHAAQARAVALFERVAS